MIGIVLGSPQASFRCALGVQLARHPQIELLGDTGTREQLHRLVATHRPSLVVVDACWGRVGPDELLARLLARPVPPKILFCADALSGPQMLAAVKRGVHGCLHRDAPVATWCRAILAIHGGETWIPRGMMAAALAELLQRWETRLPASPGTMQLTGRQREIVAWVNQGLSNKQIGRRLGISPTTVKTHLQNIFERAGVNGRQQLALQALGHTNGEAPADRMPGAAHPPRPD